jgi:hypothetical protein
MAFQLGRNGPNNNSCIRIKESKINNTHPCSRQCVILGYTVFSCDLRNLAGTTAYLIPRNCCIGYSGEDTGWWMPTKVVANGGQCTVGDNEGDMAGKNVPGRHSQWSEISRGGRHWCFSNQDISRGHGFEAHRSSKFFQSGHGQRPDKSPCEDPRMQPHFYSLSCGQGSFASIACCAKYSA